MRISSGQIAMSGQHLYQEQEITEERMLAWVGPERPDIDSQPPAASQAAVVTLSAQARQQQAAAGPPAVGDESLALDPKLQALKLILEALTGKKITLAKIDDFSQPPGTGFAAGVNGLPPAEAAAEETGRAGWGLEYDRTTTYVESEEMQFAAAGTITTSDGRQIDFQLQVSASREFVQTSTLNIRAGDGLLVDPLVLNLSTDFAGLTAEKYQFDLDADGDPESISFVRPGSGFLAVDHDHNGKVDDGTELLGPTTGDGFQELAGYDGDGNGWIDENDPIYLDLRLWTKDASGNDALASLRQHGIGAIYLQPVAAAFSIKDDSNALQGEVRGNGIYISEDEAVRTVQQIDLAV